jgi:hypothetical protein
MYGYRNTICYICDIIKFLYTTKYIKTTHCFLYLPKYQMASQPAHQDQGTHMHRQCVCRVGNQCVQGQTWHHPFDKMPNL